MLASARINILLDPNTVPDRPASGGIDRITYPIQSLVLPKENISSVNIRSIVLSNEYYNIVDDSPYGLQNNILTFNGSPAVLRVGNYNALTFAAMLDSILTGIGPGVFTSTFDDTTGFLTITSTVAFTLDFGPTSPYLEMGFLQGVSYGPALSLTSVYPLNLSGPPNLLIRVPEIATSDLVYYSGQPFHYIYPLTQAYPSLSQGNLITLGKLECALVGWQKLYNLTVQIYYTRDGRVWPYISWPKTTYQLMLEFC